jgi:hypothetical protein
MNVTTPLFIEQSLVAVGSIENVSERPEVDVADGVYDSPTVGVVGAAPKMLDSHSSAVRTISPLVATVGLGVHADTFEGEYPPMAYVDPPPPAET